MNITNTGIYKIYSVSENEDLTLLHEEKNLIPENGLNLICTSGSSSVISKCVVSSDSTPVVSTTNQIPSIVATTSNIILREWGARDASPFYYWYRATFEFGPGVANGNLTKVGITNNNNQIFSVSLFKDIEGRPTTIQPIENERLRIIYEHRVSVNPKDIVVKTREVYKEGQIEHTFTIRPALINSSTAARDLDKGLFITDYAGGSDSPLMVYTGDIGAITGIPNNLLYTSRGVTAQPYKGNFTKTFTLNLDYVEFNTSVGISSFLYTTSRGCFQIKVDPPLTKNNTQKMTIEFPVVVG